MVDLFELFELEGPERRKKRPGERGGIRGLFDRLRGADTATYEDDGRREYRYRDDDDDDRRREYRYRDDDDDDRRRDYRYRDDDDDRRRDYRYRDDDDDDRRREYRYRDDDDDRRRYAGQPQKKKRDFDFFDFGGDD